MLSCRDFAEEAEHDVGQIKRDAGDADGVHAGFGRPAFAEQHRAAAGEEADSKADDLQAEENAGGRLGAEAGVVQLGSQLADLFFGLRLQRPWPFWARPFPAGGRCRRSVW